MIWITLYHVFLDVLLRRFRPYIIYALLTDFIMYISDVVLGTDHFILGGRVYVFFVNCLSPNLIEQKNVTICPDMFRGEVLVKCSDKMIRILNNILVRRKLNGRSLA